MLRRRTPLVRLALRKTRRDATTEQQAQIDKILNDQDAMDALTDECESAHAHDKGGTVTDLLSWLLANGPAILAMVAKIVALFS